MVLVAGCGIIAMDSDAAPPTPGQTATASPVSGPLAVFYNQQVVWKNCGNADCATIKVPVDYADPTGPTVDLAAVRVKASGDKIGTLFVNPGGPGGSAVDYAKAADYIVSSDIRAHYDIVGIDPRGVAKSDPIHCSTDEQIDELMAADGTPDSPSEEQQIVDESRQLGANCAANGGELYAHMGTPDAARDMDIARAVVGDSAFNYLGKSYGTMLGQTYAELFPERVGRMVLDGALPASLDMETISKDQAVAFEVALKDFVSDCLTHDDCPLGGTADEALQQIRDWLKGLDGSPLPAGDRQLNEAVATYAVLSYLYFPPHDYDELRPALAAAMKGKDPGPLLALLDSRISRGPDGTYSDNSSDAFYAVSCLDRPYDGTVDDVRAKAAEWAKDAPTFGAALAWGMLACKDWPVTEAPVAEKGAPGSNPILVVSTEHDPATPYQWGVRMAHELDNATLLSWSGYGHTAYYNGSRCIDEAVDAYLLQGTLPEANLVCD
jgi:pimeloyl-ACP methyl ester carboxylesterase